MFVLEIINAMGPVGFSTALVASAVPIGAAVMWATDRVLDKLEARGIVLM